MLRSLAIAVLHNIMSFYKKIESSLWLLFYPLRHSKTCIGRMHFLFRQRDSAISTPQFQDRSPSCPQFNSISASLLYFFIHTLHSSLLVSSLIATQSQLCCAGKSPLLLSSSNRSSKSSSTRYQSKLAKRPILTASVTSAVRSSPFLFP